MMKRNKSGCFFTLLLLVSCSSAWAADVPVPVATDSRIKTFVYSENDVFSLVTHYGYQSNIEFGKQEEIETISVGDRVPFQVVPAGRRMFIRAMLTNARTNMTVVTSKHTYQFDLISEGTALAPNEELSYVVRFFYPDDKRNVVPAVAYSDDVRVAPAAAAPSAAPVVGAVYNYSYTFTGNDALAPVKLFDDGNATYFKFRSQDTAPTISIYTGGKEQPVSARRVGEYWVVDMVAPRFTVRQGGGVVCVYNEKLSHG
jgi:type IV secretion system protein VirB9